VKLHKIAHFAAGENKNPRIFTIPSFTIALACGNSRYVYAASRAPAARQHQRCRPRDAGTAFSRYPASFVFGARSQICAKGAFRDDMRPICLNLGRWTIRDTVKLDKKASTQSHPKLCC
jgi:hypothetical protein